jgi:hypothetical protein
VAGKVLNAGEIAFVENANSSQAFPVLSRYGAELKSALDYQ